MEEVNGHVMTTPVETSDQAVEDVAVNLRPENDMTTGVPDGRVVEDVADVVVDQKPASVMNALSILMLEGARSQHVMRKKRKAGRRIGGGMRTTNIPDKGTIRNYFTNIQSTGKQEGKICQTYKTFQKS